MTRKGIRLLCFILLGALLAGRMPMTAHAIGGDGLYASSPYTGMVVQPGKRYSFEVTLDNKTEALRQVDLAVTQLPEGWAAAFDASGKSLTQVTVRPSTQMYVNLAVTIPTEAPDGSYQVTTTFTEGDASQDIVFTLELQREMATAELQGKLDVQFPELTGPAGSVYKYRVTYNNDSGSNQSFSLNSAAAEGWLVTFKPMYESSTVASIVVDAHGSQVLDVEVTVPPGAAAGQYTVPIAFVSETETISSELIVTVLGSYGLTLNTQDERLNMDAYAGKETILPVVVTNSGTAPLTDVALSADAPLDWSARFSEPALTALEPGESVVVPLTLLPSSNAVTGDYVLTLQGANYGVNAHAEIRVSVKTPVQWGFVGALCLVAIVALVWWVFRKFGRK